LFQVNYVNIMGAPMDLPDEKLIIKLRETLTERGIGALLAPWQSVREGKARNGARRTVPEFREN
jgi:hypothetical protein